MTAPVTSTSPTPAPSASPLSQATIGGPMGKNEFIKLLVAQMTHQDPLNPTDGEAMAAQLAQFSSVEQLMNIGTKIDAQTAANSALLGVVNNSSAMNLIDRTVTVRTDHISVGANGTKTASVDIPSGGGITTMRITDADGKTIRTIQLGQLDGGSRSLDVARATDGLPPGEYRLAVSCSQNGTPVDLTPRLTMKVDGVRFGNDGAAITSGGSTYPVGLIDSISSGT